ncbi:MAG: FAD-dependent oxidoreductase [Ornithinibacter sp.]
MARVTVVGTGVIGLTTALELARAGHSVHCVGDQAVLETVSAVAGGLWFPYHVDPRDRVLDWGSVALARFDDLATDPASGVSIREGVMVERGGADRWWTQGFSTWREADAADLPHGAEHGVVATVPIVTMPVFLPWLLERCVGGGVAVSRGVVADLGEVDSDVVVVAGGLRSPELLGLDAAGSVTPSRGQVAMLANPGLERWFVDDGHPGGMVYVLPHRDWVICGGTDVEGTFDTVPDPAVHDGIVARAREAVPELEGAEVLGSRVGLRPVAPAVSLKASARGGRVVITNYGHGGAGVTLSWGCAAEVVRLVDAL